MRISHRLSDEDARLLERFTGEVYASGLSCAAILSCFNTIQFDHSILLPAELKHYLPLSPMTFEAVANSEFADLLHHEVRAALGGYRYYLEAGKRQLSGYLEADRIATPIEFAAFKTLQSPFHTAGLFSVLTVKDLANLYAELRSCNWIEELASLAGNLEESTRGASPFFFERRFEVPSSNKQLRGLRLQLNSEAILMHKGQVRKVHIRDISQGGLGVEGVSSLPTGACVTLQLPTGRQLTGEVSWQDGARAGISLSTRLALSDPLMCS